MKWCKFCYVATAIATVVYIMHYDQKYTFVLTYMNDTTPSYTNSQTNSHNFKKVSWIRSPWLNLLTVTFLAIYRWIEINLRWLIVYGSVERAKDARLLLIRSRNQLDGLRPLWRPSLFLPAPETNQCWIRGLRSWEKHKYMLSVGCEVRMVKKGDGPYRVYGKSVWPSFKLAYFGYSLNISTLKIHIYFDLDFLVMVNNIRTLP